MQDRKFLKRHPVMERNYRLPAHLCIVDKADLEIFTKYREEMLGLIESQVIIMDKRDGK